jgi:hypothetical protein
MAARKPRVHVFVDFWNFHLTLKKVDEPFSADFKALGPVLVKAAMELVDKGVEAEYAGMGIYMSTNERSEAEAGLRRWATQVLDRFPGVNVTMIPRVKEVQGPKCPTCHEVVHKCPECSADMRGTEEKGVDVRIATDMIMLAWVDSYDIAVLVSSDSDFVPVAEFLQTKGKKVIHGQLPPRGALLSQRCWGSIDIIKLREKFRLVLPAKKAAVVPLKR